MDQTKKKALAARAWTVLRVALLWARKGGAFKRGLVAHHLRLARNYFKSLGTTTSRGAEMIRYGERELSFDETPAFRFLTSKRSSSMRFLIPCINPSTPTSFYDDDREESETFFRRCRASFNDSEDITSERSEEEEKGVEVEEGERCVDDRAEEFIAKFYEQMRLQRQMSLLRYNEMLRRGSS